MKTSQKKCIDKIIDIILQLFREIVSFITILMHLFDF